IFSVLLFFLSPVIAKILNNPDLEGVLRIFSPVPLLMLPTMGIEGILSAFRMAKFLMIYNVTTKILLLLCVALPVVLFNWGINEALTGFVLASFITFLIAIYFKYRPVKNSGQDKCNTSYREIFTFSLPLLYASIWGIIIISADQFFISRYFGSAVFAEFSNGAMELPFVGMIVGAVSTVLSPVYSKMNFEKSNPRTEIFPIWKSALTKSSMLVYPLLIYAWVFADIIMVVLYGNQYEISSVYFRVKLITSFFEIILSAPLIINIGKVRSYANIHLIIAFLVIGLEYLSILIFASPVVVIIVSQICQLIKILLLLNVAARYFGLKIHQLIPFGPLIKIILPSLFILNFEYFVLVSYFQLNFIVVLVISFFVYLALFFIWSIIAKMNYISIVKPLWEKVKL
ncbi:MAG: oligosaccharide flippase family protein, partial [Saprospiraceae bacterium]|nr:oligosaccharide flippase family protein [Saprospiraceae bacterium]